MKYRTPSKKEDVVNAIMELYNEVNADYGEHLSDRYYIGRYTAIADLLGMIKIYEKEEK